MSLFLDRFRAMIEARQRDDCVACGEERAGMLHYVEPQRCVAWWKQQQTPLGGWPEPHKDDL